MPECCSAQAFLFQVSNEIQVVKLPEWKSNKSFVLSKLSRTFTTKTELTEKLRCEQQRSELPEPMSVLTIECGCNANSNLRFMLS